MSKKLLRSLVPVTIAAVILTSCQSSRVPNLTVVQAQVVMPSPGKYTGTATCPSGTTRIGGGFQFLLDHDDDKAQPLIRGDFPDNANGWVAEAQNFGDQSTGQKVLQVVAYCLANAKVSRVQVVSLDADLPLGNSQPGALKQVAAVCPTGTALSGGGYRIDDPLAIADAQWNGGIAASYPAPDGWNLTLDERFAAAGVSRRYHAYAVCAAPPVDRGSPTSAPTKQESSTIADGDATCDDTHYATAGGFQFDTMGNAAPHRILASVSVADFKTWRINAVGLANFVKVSGLCSPVAPIQ